MKKHRQSRKNVGLFFGSVSFSGFGGFQEKMLSELVEEGVPVRNAAFSDGVITGEVSPLDYYTVANSARKNGVRIRAGNRRGLYFKLTKYKNRFGLFVGALAFMALLALFQSRVQDIHIVGDVPRGQVLSILEECGIEKGADKSRLKLYRAEQLLMLRLENVAWTEVSCTGYRVNVRIEKGTEKPVVEDKAPRNIIAARDGVIVREVVRNGSAVLLAGSAVRAGDLLVTGIIDDNGEEAGGHNMFVRADAEIIADFAETREFFVPYRETVRTPNGSKTEFKYLVYLDDEYPLFLGKAFVENAVYSQEYSLLRPFGSEIPLRIKTATYTEYRETELFRSDEDCVKELRRLMANYADNFYPDYEILAAEEKYFPEEDGIRLVVDFSLRGDIALPQPIAVAFGDEQLDPQTRE